MIPGHHPPDRLALTMEPSGETLTYGELDAAANRVSRLFRYSGLQPGDHVAFCVENSATFFALAWGAHYAGLLYTPCPTGLTSAELIYIIGDCDARVFLLSTRYAEKAAAVLAATPDVERHIAVGGPLHGYEDYAALVAEQSPLPLDEERIGGRDMLYSSGTTGRPKGINVNRPSVLLDDPAAGAASPVLQAALSTGPDDVYLSPAPLYHAAPLRFCMGMHRIGGHVVAMERWDDRQGLELIGRHGVTVAQYVPTMFVRMLRLPAAVREAADISTLRHAVHGAAPCSVALKRAMLDWWGPVLYEYYAATEGGGLTWVTPQEWIARPGTVGKPLVGMVHIVGPDGEELPAGEDGAVYFSGATTFAYHNDPEKTASSTDPRGWQTVGDIGHFDEDGYLFLTDRASWMIISGGVNVYPQETEDVLQAHPEVVDAAVFGIPHAEMGEVVQAVVEPATMPADGDEAAALEGRLIAHCREQLASLKCPRTIDFRPTLPRTETGKLLKRVLKEQYAAAAS